MAVLCMRCSCRAVRLLPLHAAVELLHVLCVFPDFIFRGNHHVQE